MIIFFNQILHIKICLASFDVQNCEKLIAETYRDYVNVILVVL